jgi:hypothetical protein
MLATIRFTNFNLPVSYLKTQKGIKTVILLVILYGCEKWSLAPKEEHRLWVYENNVVTRIFETKREQVRGGLRKLHNEEQILLR